MPEINLDDAKTDKYQLVHLPVVAQHHALIKANRFLLMLVLALMVTVFVLGFVLLPRQNVLTELQKSQALTTAYATQNPAFSAEINALKGQLFGLLSGSIESKLRSLEDNIKRGSVSDSLDTLQDLKSDVRILSTYSPPGADQAKAVNVPENQAVINELNDIKNLVYLTLVSCGLMVAALAGVWLRTRYRITHQRRSQAYLGKRDW